MKPRRWQTESRPESGTRRVESLALLPSQDDGSHDRNQHQDRRDLKWQQEFAKQSDAKFLSSYVVAADLYLSKLGAGERPAHQPEERDQSGHAKEKGDAAAARAFFFACVQQHDDEHEEHHHGARVDDYLNGSYELCA